MWAGRINWALLSLGMTMASVGKEHLINPRFHLLSSAQFCDASGTLIRVLEAIDTHTGELRSLIRAELNYQNKISVSWSMKALFCSDPHFLRGHRSVDPHLTLLWPKSNCD